MNKYKKKQPTVDAVSSNPAYDSFPAGRTWESRLTDVDRRLPPMRNNFDRYRIKKIF